MGFLTPSALALAALAIPIIIFYMLKLRRQPVRVSSLMLWQQVLQDRQANAPWQRLKRNLLLLLQLLGLALLVMALARPFLAVEARVQGNVVLLLDTSASMQATDVAPNRFAAAQEAALEVIDRLDADKAVTLIAVESTPRVLASTTTDHNTLRRTLGTTRPSNGPADWETALTLAAANAVARPDTTIVIIGDGGFAAQPPDNQTTPSSNLQSPSDQPPAFPRLANLPAPLEFIPIGQSGNNQGLVALSLRNGAQGPELFLRVVNVAPEPIRRLVEIQVNDQLFDARWLNIPARDDLTLTLSGLPLATQQVRARLAGRDDLPVDDTAWAVRQSAPTRVLLVGEGNLFLERALALLPNLTAERALPGQTLPQSGYDLVIFDRTSPPTPEGQPVGPLPAGNLLFIAPPASTLLFQVNGTFTQTRPAQMESGHPLLAYVELDNLHVAQARAVGPPPWAQTVVGAQAGALLMAGQVEGRRVAILTFDLHQSDLPLQIDFPILVVNLVRWLSPAGNFEQSQGLRTDQGFNLPAISTASTLAVNLPSGEQVTISSESDRFDNTADLGIYQILAQDPDQAQPTLLAEFAVNLLAEAETDIRPRRLESFAAATTAEAGLFTGRREWWWSLLLLGLGVLAVEWWVYWRGEQR